MGERELILLTRNEVIDIAADYIGVTPRKLRRLLKRKRYTCIADVAHRYRVDWHAVAARIERAHEARRHTYNRMAEHGPLYISTTGMWDYTTDGSWR